MWRAKAADPLREGFANFIPPVLCAVDKPLFSNARFMSFDGNSSKQIVSNCGIHPAKFTIITGAEARPSAAPIRSKLWPR
jgi:hypothetical protein